MQKNLLEAVKKDLEHNGIFPKKCSCCDRVYRTTTDFLSRTTEPHQATDFHIDDSKRTPQIGVYRNCRCRSTQIVLVKDRAIREMVARTFTTEETQEALKTCLYKHLAKTETKFPPFRVLTYDEHRSGRFDALEIKDAEVFHAHNFAQAKARFKEYPEGTSMILFNMTENHDREKEFIHYVRRRREHGINTTMWALVPHVTTEVHGVDYTLLNSLPIEYLGQEIGNYLHIERKNSQKHQK
ncbi:MAG: hypothetical protein AABX17_01925 [Nanoarchaeota archaeon]